MINILLCGNKKVFDGALSELISITNKTKEAITCYIFTMDVSRIKPEYTCIEDEQVEFLDQILRKTPSPQQAAPLYALLFPSKKIYMKKNLQIVQMKQHIVHLILYLDY